MTPKPDPAEIAAAQQGRTPPQAKQVQDALADLDYPADQDTIVTHAEAAGAGEQVVAALRALPLGDYGSTSEVVRSIRVA